MHILLLGATGRTGIFVLHEALRRGHNVTALVRDPSSPAFNNLTPDQKSNLALVHGSPLNAADVANAVNTTAAGPAHAPLAVISTLNPRRASDSPWAAPHPTDSPPRMMADSIANVLTALANVRSAGVGAEETKHKVVHLSAMGVGDSAAHAPWLFRTLVAHSNVKLAYADHEAVEAELRGAKGVAWVSVRAARLAEGSEKSVVRVWPKEKGSVGLKASSARQAVAKFLLDAAESTDWDGKTPLVID